MLEPTYLPPGFAPGDAPRSAVTPEYGWGRVWSQGSSRIEVFGDITGDWGDDPSVRTDVVRGWPARYSSSGGTGILAWSESAPDCTLADAYHYAIFFEGIADKEVLRFADSLRRPRLGDRAECRPGDVKTHVQQRNADGGDFVVVDISFSSDVACYVAADLRIRLMDLDDGVPAEGVPPIEVLVNGNFPEDGASDGTELSDMFITVRWLNWCGPRDGWGIRLEGLGSDLTSKVQGAPPCEDSTMETRFYV